MKCRWNRTMLNVCGIVVAILKIATGRNFSMSGINSGHHNLPTYMKWRWNRTMLNFCGIVVAILKMATGRIFSMSGINSGHHYLPKYQILMISDNVEFLRRPFWKWRPVEIFQCWESIQDIVIYPHIKFWWYRAMLNFYPPFFIPCFDSHFKNGRHLENFENAVLLLWWWPITMSNFMSLSLFI
jgi:hypothetical protein